MFDKTNDWWKKLSPENKKKTMVASIIGVLLVCSLSVYYFSDRSKKLVSAPDKSEKTHEISFNSNMAEQAVMDDVNRKLSQQEDSNRKLEEAQAKLQKEVDDFRTKQSSTAVPGPSVQNTGGINKPFPMPPMKNTPNSTAFTRGAAGLVPNANNMQVPPPPPLNAAGVSVPPGPMGDNLSVIGDIGVVSNKSAAGTDVKKNEKGEPVNKNKDSKSEKGKTTYYLPPCFMPATLLTGARAPVMGTGSDSGTVPLLFRVKAPAILPGRVTSQIQDCFILAEGSGKLSDERIWVRTVNLSCVDHNKRSIIDTTIDGFVQDEDGMVGLSGIVTAKFGAAVARSLIAGAFGGAGQALKESSNTTMISPLGTQSQIDPNEVGKAALGGALSKSADQIQQFYMKLAEQTMPVLEVGNTKPCTIIIKKGVNLEVKEVTIK